MTDRAQFEAMLEALINEDQETAKEIFHNIVVAKSREIYEELLSEDFTAEQANDAIGGGAPAEEEEMEEQFGAEEDDAEADASDEEDDSEEPNDDEEGEENPFGDEEGEEGDGDIEDRVMDLEDALEDLKAEFEQLLADEGDDMGGMDDMGGDDMGDMGMEPEMDEMPMMEYVNKVGKPTHGDNGANARSIVAGKNDMGGTTANIAKSFSTEKGGTQGGLANPSTKEENFGNVNVPGGNAGKTGFKKKEPGHGAEKKGAGETADKSAGSLLNGVKSRAK
jgi:hypothetical protein